MNSARLASEAPRGTSVLTKRHVSKWHSISWAVASVGGVALIALAVALLTPAPADENTEQNRFLKVDTARLSLEESCTLSRSYTGTIKASRESQLSFDMAGRITEVGVDEGSRVMSGQVLAALDSRDLYAKLKQFQAQHASAIAVLAELKSGPRAETINAARAEVSRAKAELALEKANLERNTRLLSNNAIAASEFDRVKFASDAMTAALEAAQHRLAELEAGTRKEKVSAQQALVEQLAASIDSISIDIDDAQLRAPFAGSISHRHADEGLVVQPGQPVLTLVEDTSLEVWVGVPVSVVRSLKEGAEIVVRVRESEVNARIESISPQLDLSTRTRRVRAKLSDSASVGVVPGQLAKLVVDEVVESEGFWMPTSSLSRAARGLWAAYVVNDSGIVERREIEVLHTQGNRVFVRGTLQDEDNVITSGIHRIAPGQRVLVQ